MLDHDPDGRSFSREELDTRINVGSRLLMS
jgi:hypothetical protein